ncbi:hypothetical protein FRC04_009724 [Tulasnella sp. 424]|nr:hypothetical protein FRC04_009724 [Tulasnella sp. 424]
MTNSGGSRSRSSSSKRRRTASLNDRFDRMLRRVQDHGIAAVSTPTPAPSSSNRRKARTKKLSGAHTRTGDMSLQDLRGDYVGHEFAVLKQRGQEVTQGDHDHDETDATSRTKQDRSRKSLPPWLSDTFALLPADHPLQKLAPARSSGPDECNEPNSSAIIENGDLFAPATSSLASTGLEVMAGPGYGVARPQAPISPRPRLLGNSGHASQTQSYQDTSAKSLFERTLQELPPSAWPYCSPGPAARGTTDSLAVEFESMNHSPVISDYATSTSPSRSERPRDSMRGQEIPSSSRLGVEEWPKIGGISDRAFAPLPISARLTFSATEIHHPSPRRNAPVFLESGGGMQSKPEYGLNRTAALAPTSSPMDVEPIPVSEEFNNARGFNRVPSKDGNTVYPFRELNVAGSPSPTFLAVSDPNTRYTNSVSPGRRINKVEGHLLSPFSSKVAMDDDFLLTTPRRQPGSNFLPFQTPNSRFQEASQSPLQSSMHGFAESPTILRKTDRYADELVAYAAKMSTESMPFSSPRKLLYHSDWAQQTREPPFQRDSSVEWVTGESLPRWTRPVRDGGAIDPLSGPNKDIPARSSSLTAHLARLPLTNPWISEGTEHSMADDDWGSEESVQSWNEMHSKELSDLQEETGGDWPA